MIPKSWTALPLRRIARQVSEKAETTSNPIALENIQSWTGRYIESESEFQGNGIAFNTGDLLFGKLRPYLAKAYLADSPGEAVGDFHVLRLSKAIRGRYFKYQVLSSEFISAVNSSSYGSKMPRASWEDMAILKIAIPSLSEQESIADFLDRETVKIDALVAEQENLIALLQEKRQALISHAVTKGLDPKAPMKDSGVEWLGKIPAHWKTLRFKFLILKIESGTSVNATDVPAVNGELGVLKTSCVYHGDFDPAQNKAVLPSEYARVSCPVRKMHLVVSRMNTPDLVGLAGLVKQDHENLFLPDRLWQVSVHGIHPALCHYWTHSYYYRVQVQMACSGTSSSMQNLSQDQFKNFFVPIPPAPEQVEILKFIESEISKIQLLRSEAEKAIGLLKERRSALITAAVTGKIDVRGSVATSRPKQVASVSP